MNRDHSKYEEKLSAYLDGQLSPKEMAAMAAAIEQNPKLADMLEKMRRLDDMAEQALPEFDDAIMAKLEQNIMDRLDGEEGESTEVRFAEEETPVKKIYPLWGRYLSIAASIAVLFLVGRIAFKEVNKDLLSPPAPVMQAPSIRLDYDSAPFNEATDEIQAEPEEAKKSAESDTDKAMEAPQVVRPQSVQMKSQAGRSKTTAPLESAEVNPKPVQPEARSESPAAKVERMMRKEEGGGVQQSGDMSAMQFTSPASPQTLAENVTPPRKDIKGKVIDKVTGEPLAGVTVQVEGTDKGAKTDLEGQYIILDVPGGDYQLKFSAIGYGADSVRESIDEPGGTVIANAELDAMIIATGKVTAVNVDKVAKELADSESQMSTGAETESDTLPFAIMPLDSLKEIYSLYEPISKGGRANYMAARSHSGDTEMLMKAKSMLLLDSLGQLPGIDNNVDRIESLYIKAIAHYRLYLATNEKEHLRQAKSVKHELEDVLTEEIENHPNNRQLQEYADEIARWQFD